MKENNIVYFSVNNWFSGRDYPDTENFRKWMSNDLNLSFKSDEFAKQNKLCIYYGILDMSVNFTISAPREWVERNCPELLSDEEYTYETITHGWDKNTDKMVSERIQHTKKYSDFVYTPEDGETTPDNDRLGDMPFLEYCEENFGSHYYETNYWGDSDDEDEDD